MNVTRVILSYPNTVTETSNLLAWANVILDDQLSIHSIRLFKDANRMYISFPERKRIETMDENNNKKIKSLAYVYPTDNNLRIDIHNQIIKTFLASNPAYEECRENSIIERTERNEE